MRKSLKVSAIIATVAIATTPTVSTLVAHAQEANVSVNGTRLSDLFNADVNLQGHMMDVLKKGSVRDTVTQDELDSVKEINYPFGLGAEAKRVADEAKAKQKEAESALSAAETAKTDAEKAVATAEATLEDAKNNAKTVDEKKTAVDNAQTAVNDRTTEFQQARDDLTNKAQAYTDAQNAHNNPVEGQEEVTAEDVAKALAAYEEAKEAVETANAAVEDAQKMLKDAQKIYADAEKWTDEQQQAAEAAVKSAEKTLKEKKEELEEQGKKVTAAKDAAVAATAAAAAAEATAQRVIESEPKQHGQVTNISDLAKLKNLESVRLDNHAIEDVSALGQLKNLKTVSLPGNKVRNISNLVNSEVIGQNIEVNNQVNYTFDPVSHEEAATVDVNQLFSLDSITEKLDHNGYKVKVKILEAHLSDERKEEIRKAEEEEAKKKKEAAEAKSAIFQPTINVNGKIIQLNTAQNAAINNTVKSGPWIEQPTIEPKVNSDEKKKQIVKFENLYENTVLLVYELTITATTTDNKTISLGGTFTQPLKEVELPNLLPDNNGKPEEDKLEIPEWYPGKEADPKVVEEIEEELRQEEEDQEGNGGNNGNDNNNGNGAGSETDAEGEDDTATETATAQSNKGATLTATGTPVLETMLAGGSLSLGSLAVLFRRFFKK